MTFTYTGALSTNVEKVRFEIGDIDSANALCTDEEITYKLGENGDNILDTCADICEALAVRFARQADFSMDNQSVKLSQKSLAYERMADRFKSRSNSVETVVLTKLDGYQPTQGQIPNATDRRTTGRNDFDVGRFDAE